MCGGFYGRRSDIDRCKNALTGNLLEQFYKAGFLRETLGQGLIESCQGESMLPRERDEIMIRDLICTRH